MRNGEPPNITDHKNRKRAGNTLANLRGASHGQNFINRTKTWGMSGRVGIKLARNGAWEARIHKDKKYIHLGTFKSKSKAIEVRRKAEIELYGEFAP